MATTIEVTEIMTPTGRQCQQSSLDGHGDLILISCDVQRSLRPQHRSARPARPTHDGRPRRRRRRAWRVSRS